MRVLGLLALALLAGAAHAQATLPHWPLKQVFGKDAAVLQLGREAVAEVCLGETCTRFVIREANRLDVVHDFAFLYFWLVESYDLAPLKDARGARFVATILQQRKGTCTGQDEEAVGRCTLAQLAARYSVHGLENKFEQGWRKTGRFDLAARLKRAGIIP